MTTHLKTIIILLGLMSGIVIAEKSLYGTEIIIFSIVALVIEGSIYFWSKRKGKSSYVALTLTLFFLGAIIGGIRTQFIK